MIGAAAIRGRVAGGLAWGEGQAKRRRESQGERLVGREEEEHAEGREETRVEEEEVGASPPRHDPPPSLLAHRRLLRDPRELLAAQEEGMGGRGRWRHGVWSALSGDGQVSGVCVR